MVVPYEYLEQRFKLTKKGLEEINKSLFSSKRLLLTDITPYEIKRNSDILQTSFNFNTELKDGKLKESLNNIIDSRTYIRNTLLNSLSSNPLIIPNRYSISIYLNPVTNGKNLIFNTLTYLTIDNSVYSPIITPIQNVNMFDVERNDYTFVMIYDELKNIFSNLLIDDKKLMDKFILPLMLPVTQVTTDEYMSVETPAAIALNNLYNLPYISNDEDTLFELVDRWNEFVSFYTRRFKNILTTSTTVKESEEIWNLSKVLYESLNQVSNLSCSISQLDPLLMIENQLANFNLSDVNVFIDKSNKRIDIKDLLEIECNSQTIDTIQYERLQEISLFNYMKEELSFFKELLSIVVNINNSISLEDLKLLEEYTGANLVDLFNMKIKITNSSYKSVNISYDKGKINRISLLQKGLTI